MIRIVQLLIGLQLLLLAVGATCHAQAQLQQTTFVPVAPEALSSAFVRCIYKDAMGFMWFGTGNGLIRYDGTTVYRYEHAPGDRKSISNNRINTIIEDAEKNLYIGTSYGLARYNRDKDNFVNVDSIVGNRNHLTNQYITALSTDSRGRLWIGTFGQASARLALQRKILGTRNSFYPK